MQGQGGGGGGSSRSLSECGPTKVNNARNCVAHSSCFLGRTNASVYLNFMLHHCDQRYSCKL